MSSPAGDRRRSRLANVRWSEGLGGMALELDDGLNGNAAMRARVGDEAVAKLIEQRLAIWIMLGVRPQRQALTVPRACDVRLPRTVLLKLRSDTGGNFRSILATEVVADQCDAMHDA